MKLFNLNLILGMTLSTLVAVNAMAEGGGVHGGGGDVVTEGRVKEIRDNLLKFINEGGDREFNFENKLTLSDYENGNPNLGLLSMKALLIQGAVTVNGIKASDQDQKDELKNTFVNGARKICKSILKAKIDGHAYIICEAESFAHMDENPVKNKDLQTVQIAHEYHGLAGIEKNFGSDSDYWLSKHVQEHMGFRLSREMVLNPVKLDNPIAEMIQAELEKPSISVFSKSSDYSTLACVGVYLNNGKWNNYPTKLYMFNFASANQLPQPMFVLNNAPTFIRLAGLKHVPMVQVNPSTLIAVNGDAAGAFKITSQNSLLVEYSFSDDTIPGRENAGGLPLSQIIPGRYVFAYFSCVLAN